MQPEAIYPYIVPKEYVRAQRPEDMALPLGHDVYVVLMKEVGQLAGNVTASDLAAIQLSQEQAYARALESLERLFKAGVIKAQRYPEGPGGMPFIIVAGHWDAAAVILLPGFQAFAKRNLGQEDICVSIPHQGIVLAFPNGDAMHRDLIKAFVKQHEGDQRKPITLGLFLFENNSIQPIE